MAPQYSRVGLGRRAFGPTGVALALLLARRLENADQIFGPQDRFARERVHLVTDQGVPGECGDGDGSGLPDVSDILTANDFIFNPPLTIQALAYMTADAIVNRYRNSPGPLA